MWRLGVGGYLRSYTNGDFDRLLVGGGYPFPNRGILAVQLLAFVIPLKVRRVAIGKSSLRSFL